MIDNKTIHCDDSVTLLVIEFDNMLTFNNHIRTRTRTRTLLTPKQKYISSKVQPFRENQKQIKSIIVHVT